MRRYSVILLPDEDKYAVVVPALPGCVTQGNSIPDALDAATMTFNARQAPLLRPTTVAVHDNRNMPRQDR